MASPSDASEAEREIVVSHVINAPPGVVFQAYTEARHLAQWFGPKGFTLTSSAFEFRPDGEWLFVMHGPDGTDYPNWVRWQEIQPPGRLSYRQGWFADDPDAFVTTVTLTEEAGKTRITLRSVFNTKTQRDELVENFGVIEGGRQTLERLATYTHLQKTGGRSSCAN